MRSYLSMTRFAAIDFETASHGRDSACAVGVAIVEDGRIVREVYELIRPPSRQFVFTPIHGLSWNDVKSAPLFNAVWAGITRELTGVVFLRRTTHRSIRACSVPVAPRTGCRCHCYRSFVQYDWRGRSGIFIRPSCRMSVVISGLICVIIRRIRTHKRARASSWRPSRRAGVMGRVTRREELAVAVKSYVARRSYGVWRL